MQSQYDGSDVPPTATGLTPEAVAGMIQQSLQAQAAQFENVISGLRAQLEEFKDLSGQSSRQKKSTSNTTPDTSSNRDRLRSSSSQNPFTTPSPAVKAPRKSKTPVPSNKPPAASSERKRHPLQMTSRQIHKDYQTTKLTLVLLTFDELQDALYFHIKVLWGLFKANDVPPIVDPELLKEFYTRFSSAEEVESVVADPSSADLVAQNDIRTLRDLRTGNNRTKMGRGMANLDQI
ncbi:uncharacterized protein MELLADRAFT_62943 [Melampsora larici-populina 98AG31]|uniref:Uncharacterized protein n=1 Tax=Melampsora larici-populina (strain 98AG31 / pathotype 3-4-7) TaxID=747676 RepID=F4RLH2_MELLP|nr:uncharacterized protein MELLADRAFT_62943 [Melampsora larici-populina 98AG31]EGG06768.1 hypothetical protein MELLADRAFT_62943 [Melampsora larici-populina 98AG31]